VAVVGGVGAVARFALETAVGRGVLAVNLLGSLALGLLVGAGVDGDARHLLATGLLGAFTTFSSWALEPRRRALAALALGLLAVWLGRALGSAG